MDKINRYCHRLRISERNYRRILRYFLMDLEATKIAEFTGVSRKSMNRILKALRMRLAEICESQSPFSGEIEVDEAYFGANRVREKEVVDLGVRSLFLESWNARGKCTPRSYRVAPGRLSKPLLRARLIPTVSFIVTVFVPMMAWWIGVIKGITGWNMERMNSPTSSHTSTALRIFGIAKMRLSKLRGLNKNKSYLHLKETEFRFNHRNKDLYKLMLQMLRNEPLKLSWT